MTAPDISVILVTWNGWALTRAALESLPAAAGDGVALEVIVADNGSADETRAALRADFPHVRLLAFDENLGFAEANNRAARVAAAPLVMLLNNDTVALPGSVASLLDAARAHPDFDVFACQMLRLASPEVVDNRGIWLDHSAHCRQLDAGRAAAADEGAREVFGASGGACLVRRELIGRIGLFDATLGSYWEDCDFAFRARADGARCLYVPSARILHVGSATGNRIARTKRYLIQRNMLRVSRRWLALPRTAPSTWGFAVAELYYVARALLDGAGLSVVAAKRDAWRAGERRATPNPLIDAWIGVRSRPVGEGAGRH